MFPQGPSGWSTEPVTLFLSFLRVERFDLQLIPAALQASYLACSAALRALFFEMFSSFVFNLEVLLIFNHRAAFQTEAGSDWE